MKKLKYIIIAICSVNILLGIIGSVIFFTNHFHDRKTNEPTSIADSSTETTSYIADDMLGKDENTGSLNSTSTLDQSNEDILSDVLSNNKEEAIFESESVNRKVKGIYVTGPTAGSSRLDELLSLADQTEINTFVIDVKNDEGNITWKMDNPLVTDVKSGIRYIPDIKETIKKCKDHDIYLIGRIVCFKDPYFANYCKEAALLTPGGSPICDANGIAWINPYNENGWAYLADIAKEAIRVGFDEIQFDYVRFPIGSEAEKADYHVDMTDYPKQSAIKNFLTFVKGELAPLGIPVSADLFGTIIGSETDMQNVGQNYIAICETIDTVCPMIYPSHYNNHVFGLDVPDKHPYEAICGALGKSKETLAVSSSEAHASVRPWLQAFTAIWVDGHISYGEEEIRQQIQAVYDSGYEEWLLWNASNKYPISNFDFLKTE